MRTPPILQVVGYSNSGKTTLLCKLIADLSSRGIRIGTIKHDAHTFEVDKPGKDTFRHREAGAHVVSITSADKTAIMIQEHRSIEQLLPYYSEVDLVLIEGYKFATYPKFVVLRESSHATLLEDVTDIESVVTWDGILVEHHPCYDINDVAGIISHIMTWLKQKEEESR
ncbi:molybdopterin guanine dinucleotide biosynthesis accessory protein MobB [Aneurinibacillus soli]|uniref:Molybdopterin-guanine dinucleotide biosynthesis adapter protein n=1 Tax=Aneurinibacillus soli TaxID=1500254 RepID=A0A0U4NI04_9BACL|nr:molybdopterin-guanine dinucleotide biosynthesis protein B [Aneurinibacillus soli]PYE61770.1 molybdopterin guanine dinucleotide biosynthesis accessory protein MobB [Aneurinibacillus soli]BAU28372.1 Molybdopterin-guanine dinucleotide biosynthesis adapter protein [Aneurinibacillus soli]